MSLDLAIAIKHCIRYPILFTFLYEDTYVIPSWTRTQKGCHLALHLNAIVKLAEHNTTTTLAATTRLEHLSKLYYGMK